MDNAQKNNDIDLLIKLLDYSKDIIQINGFITTVSNSIISLDNQDNNITGYLE